ncbi:efflux RND transporter periplasmic adaptor subunit [Sulfurovum sp. ST-21]|uniref:Efflux RND transporter periplasmic adaptor subunit n=1 Tax=Sulfurovum indicum TaxID=2779528 RepID=A0A7M1S425_9BACT|nr:efflux RND transporter periplasmic adaptor subunit [Sulfurovum indicum]QOR61934.1 efflux RND transporter periplasmic adaptor subunit [Sulfurovum indicum]
MHRYVKNGLIILAVSAGTVLFYNKVYIPKSTYERVVSSKGDLAVETYGIGNVGAKYTYSITAQTGGKILSITTDEGRWVKKDDLLVTIDSVDVPQMLEEAEIAAKKAASELVATQKELLSLQAQRELAQITYVRYAKLKEQSFASKSEYDKAKADRDVIEAQIEATRAHIASATMEVSRAQKAVEALKEKLARYMVYAPVDGYVISRDAEVAQTVLPSQAILQIVNPEDVWVKAYIDEKVSGRVKVGQKAEITLRSQYEKRFEGTVARIVPKSDPVTLEREVDVVFKRLPKPFYINEQAEVSISSKTYKDVVKVPLKALSYYKKKVGVWTEKEEKAHFIAVKVLVRGDKEAAVTGIEDNMTLLIESEKKKPLKEGSSVH